MRVYEGLVKEIRLGPGGEQLAWVACPAGGIPQAGRYTLAWALEEVDAPLATPLFPARLLDGGFLAVLPISATWNPGVELRLRGPLGRGFDSMGARRLALAALGESTARLSPLIDDALSQEAAVALFTDGPLPPLPSAVEVGPVSALPDALQWADFLALDVPLARTPDLPQVLGLEQGGVPLACAAQALVLVPMPCGRLADCGVCALKTRRGWKLACKDGPVFDLADLI